MRSGSCRLLVGMALTAAGCGFTVDTPDDLAHRGPPEGHTAQKATSLAGTYRVVRELSHIEFLGSTPLTSQSGWFEYFWGTIDLPADDLATARIAIDVDMQTTTTNWMLFTRHLKGPVFFDVGKYPRASFVSAAVRPDAAGGGACTITGALTFHGVTRPLTFPARITSTADGLTLEGRFTLRQTEFGMAEGAKKANDEVHVTVSLRAARAG